MDDRDLSVQLADMRRSLREISGAVTFLAWIMFIGVACALGTASIVVGYLQR